MAKPGRYSYGRVLDSPSKQLFADLARDLEQIHLHHEDLKKVDDYKRRSFYERQDEIDREVQAEYYAAIDATSAIYDQHRFEAEEVLQNYLKQVEEERRRDEEEERRRKEEKARLERERQEREAAERLRKEREEALRKEAEKRAKEEEVRKKAAEEAEKAKIAAEEEKARREQARLQEEERHRQAALEKARENEKRLGAVSRTPEQVNEHNRYLELHKTLKELRKYMIAEGKKHPDLKQLTGDLRRTIVKCIGQLREGKGTGANKTQMAEIKSTLLKARSIKSLTVDVRPFFAFPPANIASLSPVETQESALYLYLLNIFAKACISQLVNEASINPKHAEPIGVIIATIFSLEEYLFQGCAFVDILWAKYRVVCPALWGFSGNERTDEGKTALGWRRVEPGGPFIREREHADRMTGLGAGFAAITLRNFSKVKRRNPFPNAIFWRTISNIVSIPPDSLQDTHFYLLNSLLRYSAEKIIGFYGHMGLALLRNAIVEIPNRVTNQPSTALSALKVLRELIKSEKNIVL